jgi:hypothetical protein
MAPLLSKFEPHFHAMDIHRKLQAERWQRQHRSSQPDPPAETLVVQVDALSLKQITPTEEIQFDRFAVLFGVHNDTEAVIDAIYEFVQDGNSGQILRDSNRDLVFRLSHLMGMRIVGLVVATSGQITGRHLVELLSLPDSPRILLIAGHQAEMKGYLLTETCVKHYIAGELRQETTLNGRTHGGGLDGRTLFGKVEVAERKINTVVHTGFYRLNRAEHTPTLDDARAFLLARKKSGIEELHKQIADYHLLLFIGVLLGENWAERAILSVFMEDDDLIKELFDLLFGA